jgi:predicted MFS family arabinose efflux permease
LIFQLSHSTDLVFLSVFLLFTVNVIFMPAKSSMVPEIVRSDQLLAANSLLAGAGIVATAIGALAGGWVIDRFGWAFAMRLDGLSYLISVGALALVAYRAGDHRSKPAEVTIRGYAVEVAAGWGLVRRSRAVGVGLMSLAAVWFAGGVLHVAGNQHIQTAASVPGMQRLGGLLFAIGVGSGIGTWWINTHGKRLPRARVLGVGLMLAGCTLVLFALTSLFAVFVGAAVLRRLIEAPALVLTETVLQGRHGTRTPGTRVQCAGFPDAADTVVVGDVDCLARCRNRYAHDDPRNGGTAAVGRCHRRQRGSAEGHRDTVQRKRAVSGPFDFDQPRANHFSAQGDLTKGER